MATVVQLVALTAILTISVAALAAPLGALENVSGPGLVGACAGAFGLALLHGSLAFAVGASTGNRTTAVAVATAVAVGGYLVQTLVGLSELLRPLRFVTPWHWYLDQNMLVDGPHRPLSSSRFSSPRRSSRQDGRPSYDATCARRSDDRASD